MRLYGNKKSLAEAVSYIEADISRGEKFNCTSVNGIVIDGAVYRLSLSKIGLETMIEFNDDVIKKVAT